ncbi:hypothetical protein ACHAWF_004185 [Thalassiosira exigua]
MQVGRRREGTVVLSRNGDLIAYGHKQVVIVDSYAAEEYRVIDMERPVEEEMKETLPLYFYYHRGLSLPNGRNSIMECRVDELKAMLVVRGGSVTAKDGRALNRDELRRLVTVYLSMEGENKKHTVYFNQERVGNGIFADIDTSQRRTIPQIVQSLVDCPEFEKSPRQFFLNITNLLSQKRFTDDYATIALEAPELQETFIHQTFIHVGENPSQKNIRSSLARVMQMNNVLYHANARSDDRKPMYIVSKQVASQNHDQKTRNKTAPGEKPLTSEYLVMMQVMVQATTVESHGHTLGIISHMM